MSCVSIISFLFCKLLATLSINDNYSHGRRSVGGQGNMSPYFLKWTGRPVFCPPTFSGVDIFCTNAHGIHWTSEAIFVKFSQLILMKIIKIVATRPCWGSLQRSLRPPSCI